jgi:hypothetical protein
MTRSTAAILALALVALAAFGGNSDAMLRSAERGFAWSIGREVAHSLFHRER